MSVDRLWNGLRRDRFLVLLVVVVATLILLPTIDTPGIHRFLGQASFTMVFVVSAIANRRRLLVFRLAIVFGDITPRGAIAQTATWMEAVTGQLFIAINLPPKTAIRPVFSTLTQIGS